MSKHDQTLKKVLYILILVYIATLMYGFYRNFQLQDMNAIGMGVVAIFTPLIVPVICKLCKFKPVYEIYIINVVFVYFASLIGSSFHGYSVLGFDKVLHFSSGLLLTTASILVFMLIKHVCHIENKEDYHLFLVFINAMNLAIASVWEFYEYFMLIFFDNDAINHYTQGVHDTMTDMLCAFVGGIIITALVIRYYQSGKGNFITNLCEKFYTLNIEPRFKK